MLHLHCFVSTFSSRGEWGPLFIALGGLPIAVTSLVLLQRIGSRCMGFSSCSMQGSVVAAQGLSSLGSVIVALDLVALRYVGSSVTRDRTCVPCMGPRMLIQCAIREVLALGLECWTKFD